MSNPVNDVVEEVRHRVRTSSGAPMQVRHIIEDVVAGMPGLDSTPVDITEVTNLVQGFGPLQPLLDDPTVEEIWINEPVEPK